MKDSEGKSKGCGFMKFSSIEDRDECLKLDGEPFDENTLSITIPNQKWSLLSSFIFRAYQASRQTASFKAGANWLPN